MIAIPPRDPELAARQTDVLSAADVQQAVFLDRPLAMQIGHAENLSNDDQIWLQENLIPRIPDGGIAWLPMANLRDMRVIEAAELTPEAVVECMDHGVESR